MTDDPRMDDAAIAEWHTRPDDGTPLHVFLGFTDYEWDQYWKEEAREQMGMTKEEYNELLKKHGHGRLD